MMALLSGSPLLILDGIYLRKGVSKIRDNINKGADLSCFYVLKENTFLSSAPRIKTVISLLFLVIEILLPTGLILIGLDLQLEMEIPLTVKLVIGLIFVVAAFSWLLLRILFSARIVTPGESDLKKKKTRGLAIEMKTNELIKSLASAKLDGDNYKLRIVAGNNKLILDIPEASLRKLDNLANQSNNPTTRIVCL